MVHNILRPLDRCTEYMELVDIYRVRRSVSRVLYPAQEGLAMAIPLGRPLPGASRDQPERRGRKSPPVGQPASRPSRCAPIRSCSRWGLPCRPRCGGRGALLPHPFTLTRLAGRFAFCGTVPGVAPAGRYPAPYSRGARTFLPRPMQPGAAIRPSDPIDNVALGAVESQPSDLDIQVALPAPRSIFGVGRRSTINATPAIVVAPPSAKLQVNGSPRKATLNSTPSTGSSRVKGTVRFTP